MVGTAPTTKNSVSSECSCCLSKAIRAVVTDCCEIGMVSVAFGKRI